jgi:hypothetical protein
MPSHLKVERQRLLDRIHEIRSSGRVAPPYTFVVVSNRQATLLNFPRSMAKIFITNLR